MAPAPLVDITLLVAGNGKYYPKDGETVAVHYIMRVRHLVCLSFVFKLIPETTSKLSHTLHLRFFLSLINLHLPSFIFHSLQRQDGTIIDNSYERAKPFTFGVSLGDVLPGWNEVVKQMSVGDKAECVLPPNLMYSAKGLPGLIEPNMNIHLEVELVSIQTSADTDQGNDKRRRNR